MHDIWHKLFVCSVCQPKLHKKKLFHLPEDGKELRRKYVWVIIIKWNAVQNLALNITYVIN
jgi:predicted metal-binding protein